MRGNRLRLRLVDVDIEVTWQEACLAPVAMALYGDARVASPAAPGEPPLDTVELVARGRDLGVRHGSRTVVWVQGRAALFQEAEMALTHLALTGLRRRHLLLHAAVVAGPEGAVLAAGFHGAGKTSLAVALGRCGAAILSDEVAPLDAERLRVQPFPRDLILHRGALRRLPGLPPSPGFKCFGDYRYLAPSAAGGAPPAAAPVRGLLFPRRRRGARPVLQPLGSASAARRLLEQCFDLEGVGGAAVVDAVAALSRLPSARLDFDAAPAAVAPVHDWAAGRLAVHLGSASWRPATFEMPPGQEADAGGLITCP